MNLDPLIRRLKHQIRSTARVGEQTIRFRNRVTVTPPGGSSTTDGATPVFIQNGADQIPAPYYGTAPAVGSMVGVLFIDGSPIILGKPNGLPTL